MSNPYSISIFTVETWTVDRARFTIVDRTFCSSLTSYIHVNVLTCFPSFTPAFSTLALQLLGILTAIVTVVALALSLAIFLLATHGKRDFSVETQNRSPLDFALCPQQQIWETASSWACWSSAAIRSEKNLFVTGFYYYHYHYFVVIVRLFSIVAVPICLTSCVTTSMALMDYNGIHRSGGCLTDQATLSVSGFLVYANNWMKTKT